MLSCIPILLVSSSVFKLVATCEVLKTIVFPFEYQGLIVPYEPKPNLKLILSCEPFLIGLDVKSYESIKDNLARQIGNYLFVNSV